MRDVSRALIERGVPHPKTHGMGVPENTSTREVTLPPDAHSPVNKDTAVGDVYSSTVGLSWEQPPPSRRQHQQTGRTSVGAVKGCLGRTNCNSTATGKKHHSRQDTQSSRRGGTCAGRGRQTPLKRPPRRSAPRRSETNTTLSRATLRRRASRRGRQSGEHTQRKVHHPAGIRSQSHPHRPVPMAKQTTSRTRKTTPALRRVDSPPVHRVDTCPCCLPSVRDGTMHGVLMGSFVLSHTAVSRSPDGRLLRWDATRRRNGSKGNKSSLVTPKTGGSRGGHAEALSPPETRAPEDRRTRWQCIAVEQQQNANAGGTQRAEFYEATKPSQRTQKPLPRQKPRPNGADSRGSRGARDRQTASAQPPGTGQSNTSRCLPTPTPTASARPAPLTKATPRFGQAPTKHDTDRNGCTVACQRRHRRDAPHTAARFGGASSENIATESASTLRCGS